jgi:glycosyltransferase involved in cell wall biosynthesis
LESVKKIADEIVVVDSNSTDKTIEIVRNFTNKIYFRKYKYHGLQMNYGIDKCTHDWVFCIDSDEFLDEDMIAHVFSIKKDGLNDKEAFRLHREWIFLGKPVHAFYPISSPDKIVRFFNRKNIRFNERPVHDKPVGFHKYSWLEGRLIHNSIQSLDELYDKLNKYTSRHAEGYSNDTRKVRLINLLVNPWIAFIKWYFFKKNFRDGFRGFILGTYAAMYTFLKYAKLYNLKKHN